MKWLQTDLCQVVTTECIKVKDGGNVKINKVLLVGSGSFCTTRNEYANSVADGEREYAADKPVPSDPQKFQLAAVIKISGMLGGPGQPLPILIRNTFTPQSRRNTHEVRLASSSQMIRSSFNLLMGTRSSIFALYRTRSLMEVRYFCPLVCIRRIEILCSLQTAMFPSHLFNLEFAKLTRRLFAVSRR